MVIVKVLLVMCSLVNKFIVDKFVLYGYVLIKCFSNWVVCLDCLFFCCIWYVKFNFLFLGKFEVRK